MEKYICVISNGRSHWQKEKIDRSNVEVFIVEDILLKNEH